VAGELGLDLRPNRQTVIRWENGAGISERYARALAELDRSSPENFRPQHRQEDFRSVRREVQELSAGVTDLHACVDLIVEALAKAGIALPR
jgi:hypothetical protein